MPTSLPAAGLPSPTPGGGGSGGGGLLRIAARLRTTAGGLTALALLVGATTGLGAVAFRGLVTGATWVFSGHADYSAVGLGEHPAHPWVPWLGAGFVVLAPVLGGLIYGPLVQRYAREARGHGVPEVMAAVAVRGGRIPGKVAAVKAIASAVTIGSGGSVGREGPIVQIGSALGSWIGGLARVPESRLRTLVACGAASGVAATFNAPIAGVFFALELILRDFTAESFGVVVLAAVVSSVIGRAVFGDVPFMTLPTFSVEHVGAYLLFALLGVVGGVIGVTFTKVLYRIEDLCDAVWHGPEWARPVVGGALLGLLLLAVPQMYGVGYPVLEAGVQGRYAIGILLGLLVAKMVATSLTIGIGGSGGVFAPSLFIGGMLGAAFGAVAEQLVPGVSGPVGAFALVGMGAVFAGAARAPITAVLILFELTGEYTIILPLMLAIVLATTVSRALSKDSVYTLKLRRRGLEIDTRPADPRLTDRSVGDVMEAAADPVDPALPLEDAAGLLLASGRAALPVRYGGLIIGQLRADRVAEMLEDDAAHQDLTVADAIDDVPTVLSTESLRSGLDALRRHPYADGGLAVADPEGRLVGWVTHRTLLRTLTAPVPDPDPVDLRAGLGSVRGVMGRAVMGRAVMGRAVLGRAVMGRGAGSRGDRVARRARRTDGRAPR
ncbi:chloride channel protein [Actinotalea sp.]|uniref:chloride channel protein n=1 Tax=Actinotalea sp. TaxID=1872145 RepID=UPI003564110A